MKVGQSESQQGEHSCTVANDINNLLSFAAVSTPLWKTFFLFILLFVIYFSELFCRIYLTPDRHVVGLMWLRTLLTSICRLVFLMFIVCLKYNRTFFPQNLDLLWKETQMIGVSNNTNNDITPFMSQEATAVRPCSCGALEAANKPTLILLIACELFVQWKVCMKRWTIKWLNTLWTEEWRETHSQYIVASTAL